MTLVAFTRTDNSRIYINPDHVSLVRDPNKDEYTTKVSAVIMHYGGSVAVKEPVEYVVKILKGYGTM